MSRGLWRGIAVLSLVAAIALPSGAARAQREGVTEPMRQQCKVQVRGQKLRTRGKRQVAYLECLADRVKRLQQQPAARSR